MTMTIRPRPGILEIVPYVGGKAEADGANRAIKLSANESALGPSPLAIAAVEEACPTLHRYPDGSCTKLIAAIAHRFDLDPARIVCGAGSDELIQLLVRAYAGPGDEVLYSAHGFLMYKLAALAAGATPVSARERDLTADVDALLARVTSRTRMVFLANPNNPTGTYLGIDELERLHRGLPDDVVLVIDAAYAEYVRRSDYEPGVGLVERAANVVMTRTFSKLFALAALRLGWMYGPAHIVDVLHRTRGPFNVGALAQVAGTAALQDLAHQDQSVRHNEAWRLWLQDQLGALGLRIQPSAGNFLLVGFDSPATALATSARLEARGILARPMGAYGLPDSLRISVGLEDENRALVDALTDMRG